MPDMIDTKIALLEAQMTVLKATTNVARKLSDWTFDVRRKNLDRRFALADARHERNVERIARKYDDQPVNFALTEAGVQTLGRSLTDKATLYVVDEDGQCTSHELTR
jgi:hypothetical protein